MRLIKLIYFGEEEFYAFPDEFHNLDIEQLIKEWEDFVDREDAEDGSFQDISFEHYLEEFFPHIDCGRIFPDIINIE